MGALQSWGVCTNLKYKDTEKFPTKSGICGMIGAAMGLPKGSPESGKICEAIHFGAKTSKRMYERVLLDDYQFTNYSYGRLFDDTFPNEEKEAPTLKNIEQHKSYILDGCFLVVLSGEDSLLEQIHAAFLDPVYPLFLGRACCIPSYPLIPIITDEYESLEDALRELPPFPEGYEPEWAGKGNKEACVMELEADPQKDIFATRKMDLRLPKEGRRFAERYVVLKEVGHVPEPV